MVLEQRIASSVKTTASAWKMPTVNGHVIALEAGQVLTVCYTCVAMIHHPVCYVLTKESALIRAPQVLTLVRVNPIGPVLIAQECVVPSRKSFVTTKRNSILMSAHRKDAIVSTMDTAPIVAVFDAVSIPVDVITVRHVPTVPLRFARRVHRAPPAGIVR